MSHEKIKLVKLNIINKAYDIVEDAEFERDYRDVRTVTIDYDLYKELKVLFEELEQLEDDCKQCLY